MALKFTVGKEVRQIVPVIQGSILKASVEGGELMYLVEYADQNSQLQRKWFKEDEIEEVV